MAIYPQGLLTNMRRILFIISFLILTHHQGIAQDFIFRLMERTDLKVEEAAEIARNYFDTAGTDRHTGYKHFQRWLYERRFHVDQNGYYIDPETEWQTWKQTSPQNLVEAITWTELGPWGWTYTSGWNPGTGRLTDVAIHPSDTTIIYVTSPGGGIWKSTNSGNSWSPLQDYNTTWMNMYAVTIDPSNINTVYAGNASGGLMKSTNAGATWTNLGSGPSGTIRKILVHPSNSSIVFVCSSSGIHRSTNGGTSFTQVYATQIEDIEFKPDDVNIMYACGNTTVVRSINNGVSWTVLGSAQGITNTGRSLVTVTPANPSYVYIIQANGSEFGRMYRSTDAGLSFITTVTGSPASGTNYFGYSPAGTDAGGQGGYDMALCASPTDANEVYLAGIIVWKSTNGGMTFTAQTVWSYPNGTGYNHADVHGLRWVNNTLYSNSDGGIFKSMDRADNWTNISTGLGIRQFYRIACSQTDPNVITGGAQDNGSVARKPAGNWVDWLGADGMEGLISPSNAANIWGTSQNGSLYRSTNGGNSYSGLTKPSAGNWITPLASHPATETTIYGGWTGFYRSTNSGSSWTLLSGTTITAALDDIAIAPSNTNYLYASRGTTLYASSDGGTTWATRTAPGTISDICVHRTIPDKIYITTTSSSNNLQVSINAGASFTSISAGLPSVAARSVVIENNAVQGLYVGMNTGVYYKNDTMSTWANYTGNLPTVAVNELEIQYNAGKLRVATYGRGVWETPLFVGGVVAVKWLFFDAAKQGNAIRLNWKVSGEKNNTIYELQRSSDGIHFDSIGTVRGQGVSAYSYFDHGQVKGILYYRIKEINAGRNYFSHIIAMMADSKSPKLLIAPNPVTDGNLRFSFIGGTGQSFEVDIYSNDGRVMLVHKQTDAVGLLSIGHLPNGIYTVLIRQGNEQYKASFVKGN